ncbi:MAG: type II toxin-antitoxin system RelE family toxin [Sporichthyaceae bacterium]
MGGTGFRRLHVGDLRVLYEVDPARRSVAVMTIGRVGER